MSKSWPKVRLGEILQERRERPDSDAVAMGKIRIISKIGFDTGKLELRQESATKTGMILIHPGDLVLSGINAAKGAIAIYDKKNREPVAATIHYGAYSVVKERVDISYLWWYLRSRVFRELLLHSLRDGIKTELKSSRFLPLQIPLPSLYEQRRIVARIEQLSAEIETARRLRKEAVEEAEAVCRSILFSDADKTPTPMNELVRLRQPDIQVAADGVYQFAGVYSFGRGVFRGQVKTGLQFAYPRLTILRAGNFLYPKLMAWEGAFGVVPKECDGCVVSTEFPVFEVDESRVVSEVLDIYFRTPSVWPQISSISSGTNVRRRRLNPEAFLKYRFPLPRLRIQLQMKSILSEINGLTGAQAETAVELDALLPSILDRAFKGAL